MPILDAVRTFIRSLRDYCERQGTARAQSAEAFMTELFALYPFTTEAEHWLRQQIRVQVDDLHSTGGGGGWHPERRLVHLHTAQYEAAIHELAHAIWHEQRRDRQVRDALAAAVQQLAEDNDPRWSRVHTLAQHYVHGIPTQPGFERGMLLPQGEWGLGGGPQGEWNDWEMFAGLASGCMADIRLLPPYVRRFFSSLFRELPPGVPSPEASAPHR
jgi:hypothetical protein